MEQVFPLHRNQPLTIKVIQQILAQQLTPTYSADFIETIAESDLPEGEALTPAEWQAQAIGLGSETPAELNPVMLLLLADFFAKNPITASAQIVSRILEFYRFEVWPQVFSQGLYTAPTAHLLLPVFGAGKVYYQGYLLKAADVHDIFSWQPIPRSNQLPASLTATSFLGLSNLVYCFLQLKKLVSFTPLFLPTTASLPSSENLFSGQIDHLETQINSYFAHPETKHLNGLLYQLVKLCTKFGEHVFENLSRTTAPDTSPSPLNSSPELHRGHLLDLGEVLTQENIFLFESNSDLHSGLYTGFKNQLMRQPSIFLKNLERIAAIATYIQLTTPYYSDNILDKEANLRVTYRNQVIDVLQNGIFDELIRKTIAFMYAHVASKF